MDDDKLTTKMHHILAYGTTILEVVYTNNPETMERTLAKYEQWLGEDKHKFVGLDLEYTPDRSIKDQKVAVIQLGMRHHILIFHYCRSTKSCPALINFLQHKGITFSSVDIRGDKEVLCKEWIRIPEKYHVNIQDLAISNYIFRLMAL